MPSLNPPHPLRTPLRPSRSSPLALALALVLGLTLAAQAPVQAQSLLELYGAAQAYDAPYQSARSQAESVVYKAEQSRALRRPLVNATGTLSEARTDTPYTSTTSTRSSAQSLGVTAQQSLFNRGNDKTIAQDRKSTRLNSSHERLSRMPSSA